MDHVKTWPRNRAAAVQTLAEAIAKMAPEFGERVDPESITLTTKLGAHWMFRACRAAAADWPYKLKEGASGWTSNDTVGDFLDKFADIPEPVPTT